MTDIQNDFSESALSEAIEANLFEMFPAFHRCLPNSVYQKAPDATWFMSDLPFMLFNGVIHARLAPDDLDARIREIVEAFKSEQKAMVWWTGPATRPQNLEKHLEACGLLHIDDAAGMAVDLNDVNKNLAANPAVTVKRVANLEDLEKWANLFAANFELRSKAIPQFYESMTKFGFDEQGTMRHYLGLLNGEAVGTSTLYLSAGVAGIYNVGSLPKMRRQGVGTALTIAPLLAARDLGYRIGILHASEMGYNIYRRIGFKRFCTIGHYVYLPSRAQHVVLKFYLWVDRLMKAVRYRLHPQTHTNLTRSQ